MEKTTNWTLNKNERWFATKYWSRKRTKLVDENSGDQMVGVFCSKDLFEWYDTLYCLVTRSVEELEKKTGRHVRSISASSEICHILETIPQFKPTTPVGRSPKLGFINMYNSICHLYVDDIDGYNKKPQYDEMTVYNAFGEIKIKVLDLDKDDTLRMFYKETIFGKQVLESDSKLPMVKPLCEIPEFNKVDCLLQRLWTKAVGTKDYDKNEWKQLQKEMEDYQVIKRDYVLKPKEPPIKNDYLTTSHYYSQFLKKDDSDSKEKCVACDSGYDKYHVNGPTLIADQQNINIDKQEYLIPIKDYRNIEFTINASAGGGAEHLTMQFLVSNDNKNWVDITKKYDKEHTVLKKFRDYKGNEELYHDVDFQCWISDTEGMTRFSCPDLIVGFSIEGKIRFSNLMNEYIKVVVSKDRWRSIEPDDSIRIECMMDDKQYFDGKIDYLEINGRTIGKTDQQRQKINAVIRGDAGKFDTELLENQLAKQHESDIKYFQEKLIPSLGVPKEYIFNDALTPAYSIITQENKKLHDQLKTFIDANFTYDKYRTTIGDTISKEIVRKLEETKSETCDCCLKGIPKDEHRVTYQCGEHGSDQKYQLYHVCFECCNKLQKMPHGRMTIQKSIDKIREENLLALQPSPPKIDRSIEGISKAMKIAIDDKIIGMTKLHYIATEPDDEHIIGTAEDVVFSQDVHALNSWVNPGMQYNVPGRTHIKPIKCDIYYNESISRQIIVQAGEQLTIDLFVKVDEKWYKFGNAFISSWETDSTNPNKFSFYINVSTIEVIAPKKCPMQVAIDGLYPPLEYPSAKVFDLEKKCDEEDERKIRDQWYDRYDDE